MQRLDTFILHYFIQYTRYTSLFEHLLHILDFGGGVKVAHKVVVKLDHLNVSIHPRMLVDRVDVVLSMESVRGEAPNILRKTYHDLLVGLLSHQRQ